MSEYNLNVTDEEYRIILEAVETLRNIYYNEMEEEKKRDHTTHAKEIYNYYLKIVKLKNHLKELPF
jgi:hypothetical protein